MPMSRAWNYLGERESFSGNRLEGGKVLAKNSCASSKVATAGGAIGGRAGTGGHYQLESDGLSCDRLTFGHQPHPQRRGLYTSRKIRQRLL